MKKIVKLLIRLIISLSLISYFLITLAKKYGGIGNALHNIFIQLKNTYLPFILISFTLTFVGLFLMSSRWKMLLKVYSKEFKFTELFSFYLMATFFNNFLPSTIGGDSLRVYKSQKKMGKTTKSITVVVIERLTGLFALFTLVLIAFIIKNYTNIGNIKSSIVFLFLILVVGFFIILIIITVPRIANFFLKQTKKLLPAKLQNILRDSYDAIFEYYKYPKYLFSAIGISLIHQFNMVLYYFFILRGIGENLSFIDCMLKIPMVIFLLMVIPAVNGLGVRSASFAGLMGLNPASAMAIEAIDLGIRFAVGAIGGIVFLFKRETTKDIKNSIP